MAGRHASNCYLISKSGTQTEYRNPATPTGYLTTIGLLTRRLPTLQIRRFAICGHTTCDF
eukprot:6196655-Pleurochrysis_carterae.AAC.2